MPTFISGGNKILMKSLVWSVGGVFSWRNEFRTDSENSVRILALDRKPARKGVPVRGCGREEAFI